MATGAGLAEWEQTHGKKKTKWVLTSTGLLMEGELENNLECELDLAFRNRRFTNTPAVPPGTTVGASDVPPPVKMSVLKSPGPGGAKFA